MKCAGCGQANPEGARFCNACGARLDAAPAPAPSAYTPRHLAEKILTSREALEGERKQVTVLFADLKGSMELLADRDPEEARRLLDAVLERMMEAVHRYEGTVNQVMGDGIMALFGAPLAHEDHAVRACYAALRMQASVTRWADEIQRLEGTSVRIRVGLNSGEVLVRSIGSDLHMDYTAVGQTTHLAARMEQMAAPGTILITPWTLRLAEWAIRASPLGPRPVRGLDAPLEVHELVGAVTSRSILKSAAARRLTRFVGRRAELARLQEILAAAHAGRGQMAAVTADPGVGKTRLVYELVQSSDTRDWRVLESSSVLYEQMTSYLPIIELLRKHFELDDADGTLETARKAAAKLLGLDSELDDAVAPILSLLDALPEDDPFRALDARERRRRILDALTRMILRESDRQPLLLVFENLQWADAETQAVLDSLLERVLGARLMLLLDYRPEFEHDWRSRPGFSEVAIAPLEPASAEELLQALLGADRSLAPLRRLLVERSQGNPFYLEEIVRTLAETKALAGERGAYRLASDLDGLQVPATVQAVLAARIDRLPHEQKVLLQSASVIGVDVPLALLEAIAERPADALRSTLGELVARGFLDETRLFPDIEYRFRNVLARDVAYASLLREQRRALHARIVEAIETVHRDRLPNHLDQLAYHATTGEVWAKAAVYNRQVAARAVARSANLEAVRASGAALHAVGRLPQTRTTIEQAIDIRLDMRPPLLQLGRLDEVLAVSREAERIARELGDEQRLARVYAYLVNHHYLKGETALAIEYGERCLAVGRTMNDVALQALARQYIGQSRHALGDHAGAERILLENVEALDEARAGTSYVASCAWLAMSLADRGEFEAAYAAVGRALLAAEGTPHAYSQTIAWTIAGLVSIRHGHLARAVLPLERSLEACRRKRLTVWQPIPSSLLGLAFVRMGHVPEGLSLLEDAVRLSRELGIRAYLPSWITNLAEGYLAAAQHARARVAAEEALELATAGGERGQEAAALALLGDIAARSVPAWAEEAHARYAAALALARELGLRPLSAEIHLGASRLCAALGAAPDARRHRAAGEALLGELNMRASSQWGETEVAELGHLFIVARANTDLYDFLAQELSDARTIQVILDRRQGERRQPPGTSAEDRRQAERRRAQLDEDLRDWGLAVAPRRP
ncbi:MAG TPA: adenylate/guanylate cyclase domain-containing protein [Methylomirabilota bacterium]|nr:adenylate/guanylate cyclase domain-containing protein [Methylomirabilota bacterium]